MSLLSRKLNPKLPLNNLGNLPQEVRQGLKKGNAGNLQTVEIIKRLAHSRKGHPLIRKLTENVLKQYKTKSQDFLNECYAIATWVRDVCPYAKDPLGIESLKDPVTMVDLIKRDEFYGDCDDMALLITTMLLSIGHRPLLCIVRYPNANSGFQHIYVCTYQKNYRDKGPKKRLVMDAIVKDKKIGYEVPYSYKKEIVV